MTVEALATALANIGLDGHVEARQSLAIVSVSAADASLKEVAFRRRVLALARAHGFTHIALEVVDATDGAPFSRN